MSGKFALIIGNTEYTDPGLAQLTAPGKDAEDFARVLKDQEIGAFDSVNILLNQSSTTVAEAIDELFDQKKSDDLLVLYFSGHGVRDELGALYLAVKNTIRSRLRITAIKSDFIRESMDQSHSKRQVLILDCCNSGAFASGTKAAAGTSIGTASAFEAGFGRVILTASDSTQFAWEGDKVIGETDNSLFTHFLVEGLEGEADRDGDGRISVDELYDYAFEKVRFATPKQTPSKFSNKQQGEIILRQSTRFENIKPVDLPDDLTNEIDDTRPAVRESAVQRLEKILKSKNIGLARSAIEALEKIAADENTTRRVEQAARQALDAFSQAVQKAEDERLARENADKERKAKEDAERIAAQKAEEARVAAERADTENKIKIEAERLVAEEKRIAREKAEARRIAREEAASKAAQKAEDERLAREEAEAERTAKEEAEHLAIQKAKEERTAQAKLVAERKVREEAERIAQYMQKLQEGFTQYVGSWSNLKTHEAQARLNVRLDNEILDLYSDGKGYLFTPVADSGIIQKAAKLARHTNIYIIAYNASDDLIQMVAQMNHVEIYRISNVTKTSNYWSWIEFEIFYAAYPKT